METTARTTQSEPTAVSYATPSLAEAAAALAADDRKSAAEGIVAHAQDMWEDRLPEGFNPEDGTPACWAHINSTERLDAARAALAGAEAEHERTTAQIIDVFSSDAGPMVADTIEVLVRNAAGVRA